MASPGAPVPSVAIAAGKYGWEKMKPFLEGKTVKDVIVLPKKPVILLAG